MPNSILEAIKMGLWDFEPTGVFPERNTFRATDALPGTEEKLRILAERVQLGLPLWHQEDRRYFAPQDVE